MPATFKNYQPSILPGFLSGPNGFAYAGVLGNLKDQIGNDVRAAAVVGMPNALQPDALPAIAFERQLQRGLAETDAQFAGRLQQAFDAWKLAGTPLAILLQLEILYPTTQIAIITQAGLVFTLLPPAVGLTIFDRLVITEIPGGWSFDGNNGLPNVNGFWSRFCLLIYDPPASWTSITVPPTSGTSPSLNEVNDLTKIVLKWKPAKATFMGTIVRTSGLLWGYPPSQNWGDPGLVWGGTSSTFAATLYT